ncbi:MAG: hypothetical protein ABI871_05250 [Chthoniobacterales bacterium]
MPNYGYHLARAQGGAVRSLYRRLLPRIVGRPLAPRTAIPLEVFSYSNEAMLPEQIACIRSFLRYAGRPIRFSVVSDGTHLERSRELLEQIDDCVRVVNSAEGEPNAPSKMRNYLTSHPTGRQLALIMSLPVAGPTLYVDADVLFFAGAAGLSELIKQPPASAMYLGDCQFAGDARLLRGEAEKSAPVNTGFLLLFQPLDWSLGIARFLELSAAPIFFTNQTLTHLTMHANRATPFDPCKFVLRLDDQCEYRDRYAGGQIAMRHYVNPVRHKLWNSLGL